MKKLLTVFVSVVLFSSCSFVVSDKVSPQEENKTFDVKDFTKLDLGSAFYVTVSPSTTFEVKATGDGSDIDDLDVRVVNGSLKIDYLNKFRTIRRYRMNIEIKMPTLTEANFSGATDVEIGDLGQLTDLDLSASGASKIRLRSAVNAIKLDISGASSINLMKKINTVNAEVSGASTLNAFEADVQKAYLDVSGASQVNIAVSDLLEVDASGASTVLYRGDPQVKDSVSGGSKVKKD